MKKKIGLISTLTLLSLTLSSCSEVPFKTEDFTSRIFFNLWDFLATFLAFLVLVLVGFYFCYKPVKAYIKKRQDYIDANIKEAENREESTRNIISEAEKIKTKSKQEALLTIKKAENDALLIKDEIILKAKEEALEMKNNAKKEIAQEIEASKDDIHRQIVDVALSASSKVLNREINEKDNHKLVEDFVKEIEEGKN